jgi:2-methylcitrate dehydratase PrpD
VDRGWHRTAAMGVFGAAAAAGKLLRLTPEQMLAAFGIGYGQAAGNRQCILDGALSKRLQAGSGRKRGCFLGSFGANRVYRRA